MEKIYLLYHNDSWDEYSQPNYVLNSSGYEKFITKFEETVVKPSKDSIFGFVRELTDDNICYKQDITYQLLQMMMNLYPKPYYIIKKEYIVVGCTTENTIHSLMHLESSSASLVNAKRFLNAFNELYPYGFHLYFVKLENENRLHPIFTCNPMFLETMKIANRDHKYYDIMIDFYNHNYDVLPDFVIIEPDCAKNMLENIASRACASITPKSQYRIFEYEMDKNGVLITEDFDPLGLQRKD